MRGRVAAHCAVLLCLSVAVSAIAQTVSVKGTVIDSKGKPVAGALATLTHLGLTFYPDGEAIETVATDSNGRYAFSKPLKFLTPHGTEYSDHYLISVADDSHAPGWTVITGSDEPADRDIVLDAAAIQKIEVKRSDGDPLEGASICIIFAGDTQDHSPAFREPAGFPASSGVAITKTDATGNASMHLPRTSQRLLVSHDGYASESVFLPAAPSKEPLSVHLFPAGSVKGAVTDPDGKPLADAMVVIIDQNNSMDHFRIRANAQGQYECHSLRPGSAPTQGGRNPDYAVYLEDSRFGSPVERVTLDADQVIENVNLAAEVGTLVRVKVVEQESGHPVAGAYIWGGINRHPYSGFTDERGIIEWHALGGDASMDVSSPPGGSCYVGENPAQQFSVSGDEQEITLELPKLEPLANLRGRVVDASGKGLASIKVMIGSDHEGQEVKFPYALSGYKSGTTRADGSFIIKGFPVGRHLSIYAETRNHHSIGTMEADITDGLKELTTPITLSDAGSADLDLSAAAGVATGNMRVEVAPMVGDFAFMRYARDSNVDADGHLKIGGILPGLKYRVQQQPQGPMGSGGFQYDGELIPAK